MGVDKNLEVIKNQIKQCLDLTEKGLVDRREWGDLNFTEIENEINLFEEQLKTLIILPIQKLNLENFEKLNLGLQKVFNACTKINTFNINQGNPQETRRSLITGFQSEFNVFSRDSIPIIGYLSAFQGPGEKDWKKKLAILNDTVNTSNEKAEQLNRILEAARNTSAETGAAAFSISFDADAKKLKNGSKIWLGFAAVLAAVTLGVICLMWSDIRKLPVDILQGNESPPNQTQVLSKDIQMKVYQIEVIQSSVFRLIILSLLFSGVFWCARQYRILSHLSILSHHRALSLNTLETFLESTKDPEIKNAIILEVSRAVFQAGQTGFIEGKEAPPSAFSHVREITKNFKSSG
ncbi:MAG: hypothetical protein IH886_14185 [Nitrospinae bacterium]|nr:hypothetical protein [Nitrospinota bacterium]